MQRHKMMFVLLSIISLSGCQTQPGSIIRAQKFISFEFVEINGKKYIDPDLSFCLEREYQYSREFLGPKEKFRNTSIEKCDRMTGYSPSDYVDIFNFLEEVRQEILNHER